MDNLISVFMNYKIDRLVEYGVFAYQEDNPFIRDVFYKYFQVYVDNYYYGIFHTIEEDASYSDKNLRVEFKGIMEEMLDDYREYELQVSNEEYTHNRKVIQELNDFCYQLFKIDWLSFENKDEISSKVLDFMSQHEILDKAIKGRENPFVRLVRVTYQNCRKLLDYQDNYYQIASRLFEGEKDKEYLELQPNIKVLETYRKSMVQKIYRDERLGQNKVECILQKISLLILRKTLEKKEIPLYFVTLSDTTISRGKIKKNIGSLLDNPLLKKYVVLVIDYNIFTSQKSAFDIDYQFACIQDYVHINDIYQKTENIAKEEFFSYLIVSDYRFKDRDFFIKYENNMMKMLLFEEE